MFARDGEKIYVSIGKFLDLCLAAVEVANKGLQFSLSVTVICGFFRIHRVSPRQKVQRPVCIGLDTGFSRDKCREGLPGTPLPTLTERPNERALWGPSSVGGRGH